MALQNPSTKRLYFYNKADAESAKTFQTNACPLIMITPPVEFAVYFASTAIVAWVNFVTTQNA